MSITYGLTAAGFVPKPLIVIRQDLENALRSAFGQSIKLGDRSIFGQIVGILAERLALLWEQLEAVNSSQDPDKAIGALLDALCALTGTFRPSASYTSVLLALTGTPSTVVAANNRVATTSTAKEFQLLTSGTITLVSTWAPSTGYAQNARVTLGGHVYQCTVAGISASSGGPTGTATDITDGFAHWTYLGEGTGACDVAAQCIETGPIEAVARDITTIVNSVGGWLGVINVVDATTGRALATDQELRVLREQELGGSGDATIDAIRAVLLKIPELFAATVFANPTDFVDADGMPPHSVEAMVRTSWTVGDARDQLIRNALLKNVAAGIVTTGLTTGTAIDSQGTSHTIKFSRPIEKLIYAKLTITVDPKLFPSSGATEIRDAIVKWGNAQDTGRDAVASAIAARAFLTEGVLDVTSCLIDIAPSPTTSTTIAVGLRELAVYDSGRINITIVPGTP